MREAIIAALLCAWAVGLGRCQATPYAARAALGIRAVIPNRTMVPRWAKFELSLGIDATYDNPFDPDDVDVWAVFRAPSGKTVRVNAFFDRPFQRKLVAGREVIEPSGDPHWTLRFAPPESGEWAYTVSARDRTGVKSVPEARFQCSGATSPAPIVRAPKSPRMFARADGSPYFAVGLNMSWGGPRGSFDFDDWLPALATNGGNFIRLWMVSWNCALEWTSDDKGDWRSGSYHGLGVYSLDHAWKLDTILDAAESRGIAVMLCLGTFGEFTTGGFFNEGQWKANPYNAANGGPCATPDDFWTNETARKLYRRRLRYIAARYGCRANLHSWEFWNEVPPRRAWLGEMARFLKGTGEFVGAPADPHGHLVTTTYGDERVWAIPEIDLSQSHSYGVGDRPDHAPIIRDDALAHAATGKPHLMGEFGIDYRKPDTEHDPASKGVNLHNGLWASLASGNAGTAMVWWWDNYVHPKNLWGLFAHVRAFVATIPWIEAPWSGWRMDAPVITAGGVETFSDMQFAAAKEWSRSSVTRYYLDPTGLRNAGALPGYLFSPGKPELRTIPEFVVSMRRPGRFVVNVDSVCTLARLRIGLDGNTVREVAYDAAPVPAGVRAPYEKTELNKDYNCYVARYNQDVSIDVPAGEHTVTLEVTEGDWLSLESITVTGYRSSRLPELDVYGRQNGKVAFAWFHNPRHNWKRVGAGESMSPIAGASVIAHDLPDGEYQVAWWDTWEGRVTRREAVASKAGALLLKLPDLLTDLAVSVLPKPPAPPPDASRKPPARKRAASPGAKPTSKSKR